MKRLLVCCAHPDDADLGLGAAIARWQREGVEVAYLYATDRSDPTTINEARDAAAILGAGRSPAIVRGGLPDCEVASRRAALLDLLETTRDLVRPDTVVTSAPHDMHQDHEALLIESRRAFKHETLLTWSIARSNRAFAPLLFVAVTQDDMERKVAAVACYRSEAKKAYCRADAIWARARYFGSMVDEPFAEVLGAEWFVDRGR